MPKPPVTRERADEVGRIVVKVITGIGRALRAAAGWAADAIKTAWRMVGAVPPAVRLLVVAGVLMLVGVVGAIALPGVTGLISAVVVVPVSSITVGVVGHRLYSGLAERHVAPTSVGRAAVGAPELQRSVEYVDNKLAMALNSLGTDQHQQAVIALFQAKTAVELTLGTEQQATAPAGGQLLGEHDLRPRIQAGSTSKPTMRQANSLAAS
ncbi:hypothetical protein DVS77_17550 [Mycolicibacterium moriokaense]|nr:hypothetical protein DVS77_17550 [Mycolicibacterium moriokaense]